MTFSRRKILKGVMGGAGALVLGKIAISPEIAIGADVPNSTVTMPDGWTMDDVGIHPPSPGDESPSLWRDATPPSFIDFVDQELGETLFPFQKKWAVMTFGESADQLFAANQWTFVNHHWQKGAGKTQMAAWAIAYQVRVLLAMRDPWAALNHPIGQPIDLFAVGANKVQSYYILGERVRNVLRQFMVIDAADMVIKKKEYLSFIHASGNGLITLHFSFPQSVAIEGKNPIGYVLDHCWSAAIVEEQRSVALALQSSAQTRFGEKALGIGFNWQ